MRTDNQHSAFVFCRGGSKGIPKKNIRIVAGKPLLVWTIECALASKYINEVIVSTDSEEIASIASKNSAKILMRPAKLARDDSPELDAWKHAIFNYQLNTTDTFISLPSTSPLRDPSDIDNAIKRYYKGDCDIVFGISESHRSPYLNMVKVDSSGFIEVVNKKTKIFRRQDCPKVYNITTSTYVGSKKYITNCTSLMDGRIASIKIPIERSLDVDNMFDLHLAELLLSNPFTHKND